MVSVLDPPDQRIWERQRDEPVAAWFAFRLWRDASPPRTYTDIADDAGVEPQTISRWAADWGWKARKLEYDRWLDRGATKAAAVTAETLAAVHLTAAAELREAGLRTLRTLLDEAEVDRKAISAAAAVRAVAEGTRLERLTLGQPTEIMGDGPDYGKLTDEEFEALRALQAKANGTT